MIEHKIIDGIESKYCDTCEKWLKLNSFHNSKIRKDGKKYKCIDCINSQKKNSGCVIL